MTALVIVITIVCILLVLVVLAQNPKGGGMSSQFGGAATTQIMGVKKTGDFLERFTWFLAIALLVLSLSSNFVVPNAADEDGVQSSPNLEKAQDRTIVPPTDLGIEAPAIEAVEGTPTEENK